MAFGDSLRSVGIAMIVSALGIAWVLAPLIAGPSLFDFLWALVVGVPLTALLAPRLIRRALRISRVSFEAGADGIHVRGRDGDYDFRWFQVRRFRPEAQKGRFVVAADLVDGRSLLINALGVRSNWTRWGNRRAVARLSELCRQLNAMRRAPARAASFELDPELTAPHSRGPRWAAAGALALAILAWCADVPRSSTSAAGLHVAEVISLALGASAVLSGAAVLVHLHRRPLAVGGAQLATIAIILGLAGGLLGGLR